MKTLFLFTTILLLSIKIFATEYQVDREKNNIVKFISDAPIEEFEGVTNAIDGYISLQSFKEFENSKIYFEVDLETLDTGIGLRNRHMRENYLETDIYRYTFFEGEFKSISFISDTEFEIEVSGTINIHGVENSIELKGKIFSNEDGFNISTSFNVALTDFNIDIPEMMFMKINENITVKCNFFIREIDE